MSININFTNRSIDFYTDSEEKLSQMKSILQTFQKDKIAEKKVEGQQTEEELLELEDSESTENVENAENVEKTNEITKNNNLKNIYNINYEESNKTFLKLNDEYINLESFTSEFLNKTAEMPDELLQTLKLDKQVLILPDEIVSFDYVVMPVLNILKTKQALNLKLSIDYKDFDKHKTDVKLISKVKPISIYAVQLVREETAKRFINYFNDLGIKTKAINFYSGALANFYISHVRGAKNASIIVKMSETKTTILAIVHGFVVCTETINAGEKDIYRNSTYKFDEYSRRSIAHKFVCYSVSQISDSNTEKGITKDQIEKAYSKTKTNPLAGNFQYKSINMVDLIHKKIDDMKMFLTNSELHANIESVFVDVKNDETFAKLKLNDAVKIYYTENDIFKTQKQSKLFNFNKISTKLTTKGFFRSNLWSKGKKKA